MAGIVRLNKSGLVDLIDSIKANGGDASELESVLDEIDEDKRLQRPVRRRETSLRVMVEELTVGERLEREVGGLFESGITVGILAETMEWDRKYTMEELRKMCRENGLSPNGHKKKLAAKLIAIGVKR